MYKQSYIEEVSHIVRKYHVSILVPPAAFTSTSRAGSSLMEKVIRILQHSYKKQGHSYRKIGTFLIRIMHKSYKNVIRTNHSSYKILQDIRNLLSIRTNHSSYKIYEACYINNQSYKILIILFQSSSILMTQCAYIC